MKWCPQKRLEAASRLRRYQQDQLEAIAVLGNAGMFMPEMDPFAPGEISAAIQRLVHDRLQLAKLAAKTPLFFNPLDVWEAQELRDRVLAAATRRSA